ncbi:MAG: hypothetical protein ACRDZT_05250, partial [Acidimicrobiales bacterium]
MSEPSVSRRNKTRVQALLLPGACALGSAIVLTGALAVPSEAATTASAEAPIVSSSAAAATAKMPKFNLAAGTSSTEATAGGFLSAKGAGVLAPSPAGEATASGGLGQSKSVPRSCGGKLPSFPAPFSGLAAGSLACGTASFRSGSAKSGAASATGQAASASLDLSPLLKQVVTKASPAASALKGVLGSLPPLPAGGETVSRILATLNKALSSQTLQLTLGSSASATSVTAAGWSTAAKAAGSTVAILPAAGPGGAPLARIIIGSASATASVKRAPRSGGTEHPSATDTPSLVTVEVDAPGVGPRSFSVVPGQDLTILK